ncbi:hypothetical protein AABD46_05615 [Vibrio parahaemolyticus]|uniref:hypothetical protein n=1 Tax=Vibrio TaxID=662 RepID=UPI00132EFBEE|nr:MULTISPECIES: hypothetical protein [Vibrio]MBE3698482.1 hypothetical protein [Vibrio parahaemolyticus]MBE3777943.1 hypothetical protein [Vibrio parahaemolyticus]MCZ6246288.1 hypothetical protein [Vibrio parahaemolyticus]MDE0551206.1 hypothetical protein [Vibrio sp. VP6]QHG93783.1 hypothetical protein EHC70_05985 [Vibrio parahaemolyticus]
MKIQDQTEARAVLITDWNAADIEEFAFSNLDVLTQLLRNAKDLHDVDIDDLSFALSASVEMLSATRQVKQPKITQ